MLGQSLSIDSAIMYFQNALSMVERKINSEVRYALNFKRTVFEQIIAMEHTQLVFNDEVKAQKAAKNGNVESQEKLVELLTKNQPLAHHPVENGANPPEADAKDALANEKAEHARIAEDIRSKSQSMIRNCHQYLCYLHLLNYNQVKAIHHGKVLLRENEAARASGGKPLQKSTLYNVHTYLSEAFCMLGRFPDAMEHLEKAEGVFVEHDPQNERPLIEKVEHYFQTLDVAGNAQ